ncbi:MAG: hypothetical protein JRG79_03605 [Deltaproteobacteria bacterium]|nr:hypothetical protein [Deltaproteobacteria bacterium]MBW1942657.1 hypothetical protein [Deltaproteobacteria bacterium]MBW2205970.1 hypothetical protein [Deltaproteobacteria bacterium]
MKRILTGILLLLMVPGLSGCWYAAAAGAGIYAGFKAKEKGYGLQNPVTQEKKTPDQETDKE